MNLLLDSGIIPDQKHAFKMLFKWKTGEYKEFEVWDTLSTSVKPALSVITLRKNKLLWVIYSEFNVYGILVVFLHYCYSIRQHLWVFKKRLLFELTLNLKCRILFNYIHFFRFHSTQGPVLKRALRWILKNESCRIPSVRKYIQICIQVWMNYTRTKNWFIFLTNNDI